MTEVLFISIRILAMSYYYPYHSSPKAAYPPPVYPKRKNKKTLHPSQLKKIVCTIHALIQHLKLGTLSYLNARKGLIQLFELIDNLSAQSETDVYALNEIKSLLKDLLHLFYKTLYTEATTSCNCNTYDNAK